MTGARNGTDVDTRRGTSIALKTIYKPELAAQAQFDSLINRLRKEPGCKARALRKQR